MMLLDQGRHRVERAVRVTADELIQGMIHAIVSRLWSAPDVAFAIQNDITNVLRLGDLTALTGSGTMQLIELKTGRIEEGRLQAQQTRFAAVDQYLRTDYSDTLTDQPMTAIEVADAEETYTGALQQACALQRNEFREL